MNLEYNYNRLEIFFSLLCILFFFFLFFLFLENGRTAKFEKQNNSFKYIYRERERDDYMLQKQQQPLSSGLRYNK